MKRIAFLFMIVAICGVLVVGCAPTPAAVPPTNAPVATQAPSSSTAPTTAASAAPVTIRWGIYADPGRQKAAEAQVAVFQKKYPNINVVIEQAPFAQYYDKMSAQIVAGNLYDVFMMSGANFQNFAPKGAFEDLTPYLQKAGIKIDDYTYEPEDAIWQDKVMAVPYELDIQALYYNKDLFDKAGVKYPDATWTWDDLLKAAQKLTITKADGTVDQWGFYSENLYPSYTSFIAQNGGSVLSEDKKKCTLNSPEAIEAVQFMVDLVQKYKVSPLAGQLPQGANPFYTGKVAMRIDGSYSVNPTLAVPFKWDVAPLPKGKKAAVAYWTQAIAMFSKSPNKDAAWTFITFLLSDDGQKSMADTKMSTPSKKSIASDPAYTKGPPDNLKVFVDSYANRRTIQFTSTWFQIMSGGTSVIAREFDPVWLGKATVKDATSRACTEIDKILSTP